MNTHDLVEAAPVIRLAFFLCLLSIVIIWELMTPRRILLYAKSKRWFTNMGLVLINSIVIKFVFPVAAIDVAILTREYQWGFLHQFLPQIPFFVAVVAAVVALDLVIYLQHRLFHKIPLLWHLHQVHHADTDFDVTTGTRFHPVEIIFSMLIKMVFIVILGMPPFAVLIFEVVLNGAAMFNHGNILLPKRVDRFLRCFIVTPDMHRVHHSVLQQEHNSNFGFNLPWWDYIFRTYCAQPLKTHQEMQIGLSQIPPEQSCKLHKMLVLPLLGRLQMLATPVKRKI